MAAPIGPVSLICINHLLSRGMWYGFSTALGASTADAFYGLIAGLGLTFVAEFSVRYQWTLQLAGGILIVAIGIFLLFRSASPEKGGKSCQGRSVWRGFLLVFTSTLSNPFTVCFFISVFSAFAVQPAGAAKYARAMQYSAGIFAGTAAWWLLLSVFVGLFKKALTPGGIRAIRILSAVMITAIGIYALLRL